MGGLSNNILLALQSKCLSCWSWNDSSITCSTTSTFATINVVVYSTCFAVCWTIRSDCMSRLPDSRQKHRLNLHMQLGLDFMLHYPWPSSVLPWVKIASLESIHNCCLDTFDNFDINNFVGLFCTRIEKYFHIGVLQYRQIGKEAAISVLGIHDNIAIDYFELSAFLSSLTCFIWPVCWIAILVRWYG